MRPLRVFTWHVHGSYLLYLSQIPHEIFVPVREGRPSAYGGLGGPFPWPHTIHEVPVAEIPELELDCVIFQRPEQYLHDQFEILSPEQRRLPQVFLEHDPPRQLPTDTRHPVDDPNVLLVHVTHYNRLMWDNGRTPTHVVEHGVMVPEHVGYTGEIARGVVVINHLARRGRRLGADIFEQARAEVPLDLVGMLAAEESGGLGEVPHDQMAEFVARYRFFFNPIRHTSLGLSVLEAMMVGVPIVGLATTEMVTTIENGVSGYLHTDLRKVISKMQELVADPAEARRLGEGARRVARERFTIERFVRDWDETLRMVTSSPRAPRPRQGEASPTSTPSATTPATPAEIAPERSVTPSSRGAAV